MNYHELSCTVCMCIKFFTVKSVCICIPLSKLNTLFVIVAPPEVTERMKSNDPSVTLSEILASDEAKS